MLLFYLSDKAVFKAQPWSYQFLPVSNFILQLILASIILERFTVVIFAPWITHLSIIFVENTHYQVWALLWWSEFATDSKPKSYWLDQWALIEIAYSLQWCRMHRTDISHHNRKFKVHHPEIVQFTDSEPIDWGKSRSSWDMIFQCNFKYNSQCSYDTSPKESSVIFHGNCVLGKGIFKLFEDK